MGIVESEFHYAVYGAGTFYQKHVDAFQNDDRRTLSMVLYLNDEEWKDRIIYWGPMGCLTGNYLLVKGDVESKDIVELMKRTFNFVANFDGEIPGAAAKDCGNYLLHDLPMAKYEAAKYLHEVLENIKEENMVYPK